jgi:hypothetical protein
MPVGDRPAPGDNSYEHAIPLKSEQPKKSWLVGLAGFEPATS